MLEHKVARLCWNADGWTKPSGPSGKSNNRKSFEYRHGFGHEEWLLDTTKIINGYHYGFLQAIGQHYDMYVGQSYDISLYSINSTTHDRWWVGEIKNLTVIDEHERTKVAKEYGRLGWLKEMKHQLVGVRDSRDYPDFDMERLADFNIKFAVHGLVLNDPPIRFLADDPAVPSNYYNLLNFVAEPKNVNRLKLFRFKSGHAPGKKSATASYEARRKEVSLIENEMQNDIFRQLCGIHGAKNVGAENHTGNGTLIDIVVRAKNKGGKEDFVFYELKASGPPLICIRNALSQLIEYSYYPNRCLAAKLVIVSHHKISVEVCSYLKTLRKKLGLPIYYQRFNVENRTLEPTLF